MSREKKYLQEALATYSNETEAVDYAVELCMKDKKLCNEMLEHLWRRYLRNTVSAFTSQQRAAIRNTESGQPVKEKAGKSPGKCVRGAASIHSAQTRIADQILDTWPLPGGNGRMIGDALHGELAHLAETKAKRAHTEYADHLFYKLLADRVPAGQRVRDVLTDFQVRQVLRKSANKANKKF